MDITPTSLHDRLGSVSSTEGISFQESEDGSPDRADVSDPHGAQLVQRCVIIQRDEKGYGLTVSGDNPVFIRSVRPDGAAARAGVICGDRIIKVNGTLVTQSNHQEVVELIKSVPYVALTLLGKPSPGSRSCAAPPPLSLHSSFHVSHTNNRLSTSERITGPQPVDPEKQQEVNNARIGTIRKMLEQELIFVENLRSELAKTPSEKLQAELSGAAKRVKTLEDQLFNLTGTHQTIAPPYSPRSPPARRYTHSDKESSRFSSVNQHSRSLSHQVSAPTLPKTSWNSCNVPSEEIMPPPSVQSPTKHSKGNGRVVNQTQTFLPQSYSLENIAKQDTTATSWPPRSNHSRQSSHPNALLQHIESLQPSVPGNVSLQSPPECQNSFSPHSPTRKCVSSESFNESDVKRWKRASLSRGSLNQIDTPPSTPPPESNLENTAYKESCNGEDNLCFEEDNSIISSTAVEEGNVNLDQCNLENKSLSPDQKSPTLLSSPSQQVSPESQAANTNQLPNTRPSIQQPYIIGMDDDDFPSDTETGHIEDHGPFNNMWRLMQNPAHLAVFIHYLLSNNDPSSLFFYIISGVYEQGTLKEMKKWAYEIHSSFLLPGAPLAVKNVDETVLHEIDDVLQNQLEKEEVMRGVFKKARKKAKKELKELLADFRNKRALGLGNIFGPPDYQLEEAMHDKNKELKIIEQLLLPTAESFSEDLEGDKDRTVAMAAAVATILKQFGSKNPHVINIIDRCPTFVAKEKSRIRFLQRNKKIICVHGHQFAPQHYHCVAYCNHCQLIIWGIGNQGYQCQNCEMNIHKPCIKVVEEHCIGALRNKKDRRNYRVSGIMENIIGKTRKPSQPYPAAIDRAKKLNEEWSSSDSSTSTQINIEPSTEPGERSSSLGRSEKGNEDQTSAPQPLNNLEVNDILAKKATSIGRSESFRQRDDSMGFSTYPEDVIEDSDEKRENKPPFRKRSDPNIPRSKSDVDVEEKSPSNLNYSGSSSNSSLSTRSLDSPSNSVEMVHRTPTSTPADALPGSMPSSGLIQQHIPASLSIHQCDDSDLEAEADPPNWQDNVDWEVIRLMKPKEKKRQDVINELFHTERTHVRNLKVLDRLFYRPMQQEQLLPSDLLSLLFPNLEEMLEIHSGFNNKMKAKRKEEAIIGDVGEMMLHMFDKESGENLMTAASNFCRNQSVALESLKNRQKKDQKLSQFLADAESQIICRRLQLKDIIATGFQRLTKYPLLLENVAKYTPANTQEYTNLLCAVDCSKRILANVNQAVKEADNQHHLSELQRRLDKSQFEKADHKISQYYKNLDLTKHRLLYDGHLTWRLNKQKSLDIHVLLLEDILVLLQKQDDKYILKFHNTNLMAGREDTKLAHSPILKTQNLFTRNVATDKSAFFLVSAYDQHAIYEFVAASSSEKRTWLRYITEAVEANKVISNQSKSQQPSPLLSDRLASTDESTEEPETREKEKEPSLPDENQSENTDASEISSSDGPTLSDLPRNDETPPIPCTSPTPPTQNETSNRDSVPQLDSTVKDEAEQPLVPSQIVQIVDSPHLIEPSEVVVTEGALLEIAEPVLTPMERLRRKDQEIAVALKEKQELVADILQIPKGEFEHFAEMACEMEGDKDAKELILAAIHQANKLANLVNDTLTFSEEDSTSIAKLDAAPPCEPSENVLPSVSPQLEKKSVFQRPAQPEKLKNISNTLCKQLTKLLDVISEQEEERKQMHRELHNMKEELRYYHENHRRCSTRSHSPSNPSISHSRPSSFISIASSASEGQCEILEPIHDSVLQPSSEERIEEEKHDISQEERETEDYGEMFVDAPSGDGDSPLLVGNCKVTDLDSEVEIIVDANTSLDNMCLHSIENPPPVSSNNTDDNSGVTNAVYF